MSKYETALAGLKENLVEPLEISEKQMREMDALMRSVSCRKRFECCSSGLTKLCPVTIIGSVGLIECSSDDAKDCGLSCGHHGRGSFCYCPLRSFIAREFRM
jgi:hypothetical protein